MLIDGKWKWILVNDDVLAANVWMDPRMHSLPDVFLASFHGPRFDSK